MTEEQAAAATQLCGLINWLSEQPPPSGLESSTTLDAYVQIESKRRNQTVLIDGGRGSGKTALMLSVLKAWKELLHEEGVDQDWNSKELLFDRSQFIVPLDIIDLRSVRPSTSLIVHVAGMLNAVVEMMEGAPELSELHKPVSWSPNESFQLESRKHWGTFLRTAAISWDGNLRERKAHIDAESFVAEVEMTERDRLDVVPAFRAFVDALGKDFSRWMSRAVGSRGKGSHPLFVIPIDDADMNPDRVAEVLQLTELLRHPRVAFLIAGDSDLFLATLKVHFAGALRAPAGKTNLTLEELSQLGVARQPGDLARRLYDKLVPAHHRCLIAPLSLNRRTKVLLHEGPFQATLPNGSEGAAPGSSAATGAQAVVDRLRHHFTGQPIARHALPDRMRRLLDLRKKLEHFTGENADEVIAEFVRLLWEEAVVEEDYLTKEERERLDGALVLADKEVRGLLEGVPISIATESLVETRYISRRLRAPAVDPIVPSQAPLDAALYVEVYDREPIATFLRDGQLEVPLSRRTMGVWLLAKQVMNQSDYSSNEYASDDKNAVGVAGIRLTNSQFGTIEIPWPVPIWPTGHSHFSKLRSDWVAGFRSLQGSKQPVSAYSRALMSAVLNIVKPKESDREASRDWPSIAEELVELERTPTAIDPAITEWARQSAVIYAAPESGLAEQDAKRFLDSYRQKLGDAWKARKVELDKARADRISRALAATPPLPELAQKVADILALIQKTWRNHPWYDAPSAGSGASKSRSKPGTQSM